jgi:hypothetical protein
MQIERQLLAHRIRKNMARLNPFLRGMEHYSKVVEVLCNGTTLSSMNLGTSEANAYGESHAFPQFVILTVINRSRSIR